MQFSDVGVRYTVGGVVAFALRNVSAAVIGLPVALLGAVAYAAPFWLVHGIYLLKRPQPDTAATSEGKPERWGALSSSEGGAW